MTCPRILIAGPYSGVGKTTVSLALMAAFRARGHQVQPFKTGPDFIDPGHHRLACGRESRNLDSWMLGAELNRQIFGEASQGADLVVIEGMMGLFDGASPVSELGSTAEIAKQIDAPVLLVIDGSSMARSAAAMVAGYVNFDPKLDILGVVFNRIRSSHHFQLLQEAVEASTKVPVVGYLPPEDDVRIADRHLGLRTAMESHDRHLYRLLGELAEKTINVDLIEELARKRNPQPILQEKVKPRGLPSTEKKVRVGVAYDQAFCFYYPDNLELLQREGAEIIHFSPMTDSALPDVDMLYLGGGYPEIHAEVLEKNHSMRQSIQAFAGAGKVVYAECGGLMYLTNRITDFNGQTFEMTGVLPGAVMMKRKGVTLGYREITLTESCILGHAGTKIRGHEFHYSSFTANGNVRYGCQWTGARSAAHGQDGLMTKKVLALYTHLHFASQPSVAHHLVQSAVDTRAAVH